MPTSSVKRVLKGESGQTAANPRGAVLGLSTRGPLVSATEVAAGRLAFDGGCPLMFDPTADLRHKAMRFVFTRTGKVPKRVCHLPVPAEQDESHASSARLVRRRLSTHMAYAIVPRRPSRRRCGFLVRPWPEAEAF
jgi:hypothetical protein